MNALLLACDTLAVKVVEATNAAAVIVEKTKNCCDVKITETICCAIVTVAGIAAITLLLWHLIQKIADRRKHEREIAKEKEENRLKTEKEYQTRVLDYIKEEIDSVNSIQKAIKDMKKSEEALIKNIKDKIDSLTKNPIYADYDEKVLDLFDELKNTIKENTDKLDGKAKELEGKIKELMDNKLFVNDEYVSKIDSYLNSNKEKNNDK